MRVKPSPALHASWPERYRYSLRGTARLSVTDQWEVRWDGEKQYGWYAATEFEEVNDEG